MIKIENMEAVGFEHAIRGMRNPLNSWSKSDSFLCAKDYMHPSECAEMRCRCYDEETDGCHAPCDYVIGKNDLKLMKSLVKAGTDHRKFMRMIVVYMDITAPLYWWKEFDTYKVGTVANSCSTMHKITEKGFELNDFSFEKLSRVPNCDPAYYDVFSKIIFQLNEARHWYLDTGDKSYWWQIIQLLPSSYNQKRTVMLNYETLLNMYHARNNHKLDEWREFCKEIEKLPYFKELIGQGGE